MYITWSKPLVCLILILAFNVSKFVKDRFKCLLDTAIIITGNKSDSSCCRVPQVGKIKFIC